MTLLVAALALTVLALVLVLWSGMTARRGLHFGCVAAFFVALGWAIHEAGQFGRQLTYEGAAATVKDVHFVFVGITFLLVPLLLWSGIRLARHESSPHRAVHRKMALAFVAVVVLTCGLGTAMTMLAGRPEPATATGG